MTWSSHSHAVPRVSVVIISYNQQDVIREAVDSVLSQDWSEIELILSDDGSKDDTLAILEQYAAQDERVVVVAAEHNQGITANCNQGYAKATGEYLIFMGGDDYMLPGRIRKQVTALQAHPDCAACISAAGAFHEDTGALMHVIDPVARFGRTRFTVQDVLATANSLTAASAWMVRASMAPEQFEPKLPIASDAFFFIEAVRHGPIIALAEETTRYRVSATSATARGFGDDPYVMRGLVEARFPELIDSVRRSRARLFSFEGTNRLFRGDDAAARRYLWESVRLQPWQGRPFAALALLSLPQTLRERAVTGLKRYRTRAG